MKKTLFSKKHRTPSPAGVKIPLGLDLGTASIKWVQLDRVEGELVIQRVGIKPLGISLTLSETERRNHLRQVLQETITPLGFQREVVLSIPLEDVSLRLLKMPALPEAELEQAVRWQIEQSLPDQVSYDDLTVDHLVLDEANSQWEVRVVVVTVPRRRVTELMDQVRQVGLKPVAIDVDPFCLVGCLAWQNRLPAKEAILILHMGATSVFFSIVVNGQLSYSRCLEASGWKLTRAVSEFMSVPLDEAEKLKRLHGMLTSPPAGSDEATAETVTRALASPLENMVVDILHSFKSFAHQMGLSQLQHFDRLYLSGGTAQLPGLVEWLKDRVGVPVERINPLESFPIKDPNASHESLNDVAPSFAVSVGLALREVPENP